jgi:hypothetical protein
MTESTEQTTAKTAAKEWGCHDAGQHFRQARIEFLKGIRALIDYRIEILSRASQKGTHIVVE